mmetsp:Transcript_23734/g.61980  ORF Transcript_23734/g.61980 Transcript_23734/m.61980 type:complete len:408 (-) Transcript_23734:235-1458(-)
MWQFLALLTIFCRVTCERQLSVVNQSSASSNDTASTERPSLESPPNTTSASTAATAKNVLPMLPLGQNTAVAIPTSFYHMQNGCLERTLTCIQRGSVLPREVIVSVGRNATAAENGIVAELEARWVARLPGFRVVQSAAHSEGTNRNAATRNATAPIVSFIDADDIPARDRVEVIEATFHRYPKLDYVLHHHDVFYKEQAHAVGHDWWLHVMSLPTRHRWATSHIRSSGASKVKYESDARTELFYDIGQTRSLRKKYGRKGEFAYGHCFNWDRPPTNHMHNGWPSFRRHLIDHVQFRDNLRRGADVLFCNTIMARFEANGLGALLGYYSQEARQSPKGQFDKNHTCVHANITCPTTNMAIVSALPELPRALAERHAKEMAQSGRDTIGQRRRRRRPRKPKIRRPGPV